MHVHLSSLAALSLSLAPLLAWGGGLQVARPGPAAGAKTGCAGQWLPTFGILPGVDGSVYAMAVYDDGSGPAVYAGGIFGNVGGAGSFGIAKLADGAWTSLDGGTNASVQDLAVFDDGSGPALYAAGSFTSAGGVPANGIARWNGAGWSALGSGLTGGPEIPIGWALEVFDDGSGPALYVGGEFASAGGVPCANVARWDGASWSALDLGANAAVRALAVFDGGSGPELYATGDFTVAGGVAIERIARWDGVAWSELNGGLALGGIYTGGVALEVFDDGTGKSLYVGGSFTLAGGNPVRNIARWDGSNWWDVGGGASSYVEALEVHDDGAGPRLYVGGPFLELGGVPVGHVASWDGLAWSPMGVGVNSGVQAFLSYHEQGTPTLYVGGLFTQSGNVTIEHIGRWKNASWSPIGTGLTWHVTTLTTYDDGNGERLYAGGEFWGSNGTELMHVAKWSGSSWVPLGGGVGNTPHAMLAFDDGSGSDLYVGGEFKFTSGIQTGGIARWNGSSWSAVSAGVDKTVYALAEFDDGNGPALYAAGDFTKAGGQPANRIARWTASGWTTLGSGVTGATFMRVSTMVVHDDGSGPALYVAGWFTAAGGLPAANIARWNGTSWSTVGGGLPADVRDLAVHDDGTGPALYAVGYFQGIWRWDGSSWSVIGNLPPFGSEGYAVQSHPTDAGAVLVVGGDFDEVDGVPADHLAAWNGATWSSLDSGMEEPVLTLHPFDDGSGPALIAGGQFNVSAAGDAFVARWACSSQSSGTVYCTAGTTSHGCVPAIQGSGAASASGASGFRVGVDEVEGQSVGLFLYSLSGALSVPWGGGSTSFVCVQGPLQRTTGSPTGGPLSSCSGYLSLDWNAFHAANPGALGQPFQAGQSVWIQAWFRDPLAPKGSNLSDGLQFVVGP